MNHDMEEKGIVSRDRLPPEPRCPLPRHHRLSSGQHRGTIAPQRWGLAMVVPLGSGQFEIGASELSFLKGGAEYLVLVLHLTPFLARQARGTHINVRKPHKVKFSCHGTFKMNCRP